MKKGFETLEALLNGEISGQGGSSGPKMSKAAVLNKAKVTSYIIEMALQFDFLGPHRQNYEG